MPLGVLVALHTVAHARPASVSAGVAVGVGVGAFVVGDAVAVEASGLDDLLDHLLLGVVAWTLGGVTRSSRARADAMEQRAAAARDEQAAQTALAVESAPSSPGSCTTSSPTSCASSWRRPPARRVVTVAPEVAGDGLRSIESVGREALGEMRRLLQALPEGDGADLAPHLAPQPDLGQLPALVAGVAAAGLPVHLTVHGDPRPLPQGTELQAFRIVQEALTNALRHAGPTRVEVALTYGRSVLELQVTDDGSAAGSATSGRGLRGMRQRAQLVGGELWAGPREDRPGFSVVAVLPTGRADP